MEKLEKLIKQMAETAFEIIENYNEIEFKEKQNRLEEEHKEIQANFLFGDCKCEKFRFYSFSYPKNKKLHEEINSISYCPISRNAIINDVFVLSVDCENFVIFRKLVENKKIETIKELFNYCY